MRHEASFTSDLLRHLRDCGWFCIKFNDRITSGIPDSALIGHGRTIWAEMKRLERKVDAVDFSRMRQLSKLQVDTLLDISKRGGIAVVVVFSPDRYISVVNGADVAASYEKKFAIPILWGTTQEAERWLRVKR